jgi:hypothetical protein
MYPVLGAAPQRRLRQIAVRKRILYRTIAPPSQ